MIFNKLTKVLFITFGVMVLTACASKPAPAPVPEAVQEPSVEEDSISYIDRDEGRVRKEILSDNLILHTYMSHGLNERMQNFRHNGFQGALGGVNTFIFEGRDSLLVFDTQFYRAAAEDVKDYIISLNKPVDKIIISHAHPDHVFGYAYMKDLGDAWATESTIGEARKQLPVYSRLLLKKLGSKATTTFPVNSLPRITKILPLGDYLFEETTFNFSEMPTAESGSAPQLFALLPEHRLMMVFDAIFPNAHQLVYAKGKVALPAVVGTGMNVLDTLEDNPNFDRMLFGHYFEPLAAQSQIDLARGSLEDTLSVGRASLVAGEFIRRMRNANATLDQSYVPLTADSLFPPNK